MSCMVNVTSINNILTISLSCAIRGAPLAPEGSCSRISLMMTVDLQCFVDTACTHNPYIQAPTLEMSRVPMPAPVPPPSEWQSWKPWRQSQPAWDAKLHAQWKFGVGGHDRTIAPHDHESSPTRIRSGTLRLLGPEASRSILVDESAASATQSDCQQQVVRNQWRCQVFPWLCLQPPCARHRAPSQ